MKPFLLLLVAFVCLQTGHSLAQVKTTSDLIGVFDGRTPCEEFARLLNENLPANCIKIKWRLTLYKDKGSDTTGRYELIGFVYKNENPRVGTWRITKGSKANRNAIVYELKVAGDEPLYLLKLDNNILYFLDQDKRLFIGNKDFSYTLNRIKKRV